MANNKILPNVAMAIYEDELDFILPANVYDEQIARRIAMEVDECYKQYEQEKAERIALETELCWDEYYELMIRETEEDACYDMVSLEEFERISYETDMCWFDYFNSIIPEEIMDDELVECYFEMFLELKSEASIHRNPESRHTVPYRRKQEVRHKKKLRRNAIDAMSNLRKRNREDLNNITDYNRFFVTLAMSEGEPLSWYADKVTYCKYRGGHLVQMPKSLSIKAENIWARAAKMKLV